ncbi:MAG: HipA N-terminal domain-containing protein [Bacteroidales bacterium]|nr:HipA N-terminal domain-containing protein [Bacteroidales bacterium]
MRQCKVLVKDREAGLLIETDSHSYNFVYCEGYDGEPVCLAMPVRQEPYSSENLFPFFFNLLSEGANREMQSRLLHVDENDDFGILLATAQTDTIGAVTVKPI